jgi:diacylglycerol kinase (ATP)
MLAELIYNPYAGQIDASQGLNEVIKYLSGYGWDITLKVVDQSNRATQIARNAVNKHVQMVIAAGGDGTINEVVNGLAGSDTTLGVLPIGTTNVWALQMGIPCLNPLLFNAIRSKLTRISLYHKSLLDAAKILVEGKITYIDLGEIPGRYFLLWAGIGMDAAIIKDVSLNSKRALGSWAYVMPVLENARQYPSTVVTLNLDGEIIKLKSPLTVITNIQLYGGKFPIGAKACVNDGKLDACVFKGDGFFTFVQQAIKVLYRQHLKDPTIEYYQFKELSIDSVRPLPVHLDGELVTHTPVTMRTVPAAIKVIVPQNLSTSLFI